MRKKNGFTLVELIAVIIILVIMGLVLVPNIINMTKNSSEREYETIKKNVAIAAENYIVSYYDNYPELKLANGKVEIVVNDLINEGLLKSDLINPLTEEPLKGNTIVEITANTELILEYNLTNRLAPTLLDSIFTKINSNSATKCTLRSDETYSGNCYFKGTRQTINNNYVWLSGLLWRIISIDTSGNLKMITEKPVTSISWGATDSLIPFNNSYINTWLNDLDGKNYKETKINNLDSSFSIDGVFWNSLTPYAQKIILASNYCIGNISGTNDVTNECLTKYNAKVGLLSYTEYTKSKTTDSYLNISDDFWLTNTSDLTVKKISNTGTYSNVSPTSANGVRPVIVISKDVLINEGDGTVNNPYTIKGESTLNIGSNLVNISVGSYVNIPKNDGSYYTMRVVSKDESKVKLSATKLFGKSLFGTDNRFTEINTIGTLLNGEETNQYLSTIATNFKNKITGYNLSTTKPTWYTGSTTGGASYEETFNDSVKSIVGLPRLGEMFAGNDIDLGNNLGSGDASDNYYWTLTSGTINQVRGLDNNGILSSYQINLEKGVRPMFYVDAVNTKINSGKGTHTSPYIIE